MVKQGLTGKQINPMKNRNSRRDFLRNAALTGGILALPGSLAASRYPEAAPKSPTDRKPLKLGIMTYTIAKDWDIDTILKNLAETGYQSVELRTTHAHGVEVTLDARERGEVIKKFEDSPLEAISLASAFSYHV